MQGFTRDSRRLNKRWKITFSRISNPWNHLQQSCENDTVKVGELGIQHPGHPLSQPRLHCQWLKTQCYGLVHHVFIIGFFRLFSLAGKSTACSNESITTYIKSKFDLLFALSDEIVLRSSNHCVSWDFVCPFFFLEKKWGCDTPASSLFIKINFIQLVSEISQNWLF